MPGLHLTGEVSLKRAKAERACAVGAQYQLNQAGAETALAVEEQDREPHTRHRSSDTRHHGQEWNNEPADFESAAPGRHLEAIGCPGYTSGWANLKDSMNARA